MTLFAKTPLRRVGIIAHMVDTGRYDAIILGSGLAGSILAAILAKQGHRVLVAGLAYRGGVKEPAFSGTYPLVAALEALGASVGVHDPLFTDAELAAEGFEPAQPGPGWEAVVLHTDHAEYLEWSPADLPDASVVVDGRSFLDPQAWTAAGRSYLSIRP